MLIFKYDCKDIICKSYLGNHSVQVIYKRYNKIVFLKIKFKHNTNDFKIEPKAA